MVDEDAFEERSYFVCKVSFYVRETVVKLSLSCRIPLSISSQCNIYFHVVHILLCVRLVSRANILEKSHTEKKIASRMAGDAH